MFNNKNCYSCGKKIKASFNFCPHCGKINTREDLGILGEEDNLNNHQPLTENKQEGLLENIMGRLVQGAFGAFEKEMQKEMQKDLNSLMKNPKQKFKLVINGKQINPEELGLVQQQKIAPTKVQKILTEEKRKQINALPKKEPKTHIRRLADRVICEMDMPEVKSIDDVSIHQLENSIEIKAIADKSAYEKIIQVGLPIKRYFLTKGKLTLEMDSN